MQIFEQSKDFTTGFVGFSWCLEESDGVELDKSRLDDYQVMLVVERKFKEVKRTVVPFLQGVEFIMFNDFGDFTVHGMLVCPDGINTKNGKDVRKNLTKYDAQGNRKVHTDFSEYEEYGYPIVVKGHVVKILAHGRRAIEVPTGYFADPPPAWMRKLATLTLDWPLESQCDLRGRMIYAFTLQIPVIMLIVLVRFVIAFINGPILGYRKTDWKPVFRFDLYPTSDIYSEIKHRHYKYDRKGNLVTYDHYKSSVYLETADRRPRPYYMRIFNPVCIFFIAFAALLIQRFDGYVSNFILVLAIVFAVGIVLELSRQSIIRLIKLLGKHGPRFINGLIDASAKINARPVDDQQEIVQLLICTPEGEDVVLQEERTDLLVEKSVRLRYTRDLKAHVCKPYPKNM